MTTFEIMEEVSRIHLELQGAQALGDVLFEKLFGFGHGQGYPKERVVPEQRNKKILDGVRAVTLRPIIDCLKDIDQELVKGAFAGEQFKELFFANCQNEELAEYIKTLL